MITYTYETSVITFDESKNTWYYTDGKTSMMYIPHLGFKIQKENRTMEPIPILSDFTAGALFQEAMLYDAYSLKWAQEEIHKLRMEYEANKRK